MASALQTEDTDQLNGVKKQDAITCHLQGTHLRFKDRNQLKIKGCKKIFHANGNPKKVGADICIRQNRLSQKL